MGSQQEKQDAQHQSDELVLDTETTETLSEPKWDPAILKRARRKVDFSILLLLLSGFFVFQLDRMNLASALTRGFAKDIHIDQSTINLGNQLMYMGIVLLEIPCNLALQKLGPRIWIPAQVFTFGFVATLQVFIKNRAGFLASRLMLGAAEAGYIPGAIYTLSNWYTRPELAKRVSIFFFGVFGGNAVSPLLAVAVFKLDGERGIKSWQWLFLLEGVFTMVVACVIAACLPASPDVSKPLVGPGIVRFSQDEKNLLKERLDRDDPTKATTFQGSSINLSIVWETVTYYRRWPHYISTFCVFSTWSPLTTYTPSIIMALGFNRLQANALAAVGASLALLVVFIFGWISDRTNRRGATVITAQVIYLVILITARQVHPHVGGWSRWGLWTAINSFAVGYHPVHNTWVQLNCHSARERSIAIAMWVMSANIGLMVGTQFFRGDDTPFYHTGLRTMIIMVSIGIVFGALQLGIYVVHNRRVSKEAGNWRNEKDSIFYTP